MEDAAFEILKPVIESSVIIAAQYCKACGRSAVTSKDMVYGMMFAARHVTGKQIGSLFPEIYEEEDSDEEEEEMEEVDEEEEPWTRYEGPDEMMIKVNQCADSWADWEPESPIESSIKNAIDASIRDILS
jgi:hypothetical protein